MGRQLEPGRPYAESWEICDHKDGQSVVETGPLTGTTLHKLVVERGAELLGRHALRDQARPSNNRFPLLLKYLDATDRLSVQVHPDDDMAATLKPPDLGKSEAWVVVAAEPGSVIYAGLRSGADRVKLAEAIDRGTCEKCLHQFEPRVGDCVFLPARTVHALGAGLLVAEIQQASNTTFRLFDWNRLGSDGKPRPLHVEQGLQAINFSQGQVQPQRPRPIGRPGRSRLVECDKFVLDRWEIVSPEMIGEDRRCHIVTVLEGSTAIEGDRADGPLPRGRTILLPASAGPYRFTPQGKAVLLDACPPE